MGRAVVLQGSVQATVVTTGYVCGPLVPATDVTWKCTSFTVYRSPLQPSAQNLSNDYFEASLYVAGSEVFALRFFAQNGAAAREANVFVLPWFDGLRFTTGQSFGWYLTRAIQGYVSTSFVGERDE